MAPRTNQEENMPEEIPKKYKITPQLPSEYIL